MNTSRIKTTFKAFMGIEDSPMKVAVSFGIGTLIAFSPWVGLHTVLAIILAMAFKLNKVAVFTAAYINNPFTLVPISTFCIWVGMKIMGMQTATINIDIGNLTLSNVMTVMGTLLMPFIWGSLLVSVFAALLSFVIIFYIFRLKRQRRSIIAHSVYGVPELTPADCGVPELTPADCGVPELTPADCGVPELTPADCGVPELTPADCGIPELTAKDNSRGI
ncbi:MAG: DUF2062 domain-containing protein [Nitrospirae bacterium]|nr:DUF2062 domain-containing protein [Nitrospirota bacterium]